MGVPVKWGFLLPKNKSEVLPFLGICVFGKRMPIFGKASTCFWKKSSIFGGLRFWESEYPLSVACYLLLLPAVFQFWRCSAMRKRNFKGRCEKRKLSKCVDVCRTYDKIQYVFADILNNSDEVVSFQVNVPLDGMDGSIAGCYTSDFVCTKKDNDLMVRECVERRHLTKPLTVKLLQASRDFWLRRGISDWGIVVEKGGAS